MSGQHRIDKFIIHCQASENTGRGAVKAIASNREAIITIINSMVERYASIPETITIKSLNLDLGKLYVSDLPEKFNDRLARLLEAELKAFFARSDVNAYLQEQGRSGLDPFLQLRRYLHVGFDEHLLQDKSFDLEQFVQKLFEEDSNRLAAVFTQAWSHENARKRLLQLSPETREALRDTFPLSGALRDRAVTVPGEAFSLLAFYYDSGHFPDHATTLQASDIETLLHEVLLTERQKLVQYLSKHISEANVLQRLADTLSLTMLKTVILQLPGMDASVREWNELEASANAVLYLEFLHTPEAKKTFLLYATEKEIQKKVMVWADFFTKEIEIQAPAFDQRTYLLSLERQLRQTPFPHTQEVIDLMTVTTGKLLSPGRDVAGEKLLERVKMYLTDGTLSGDDGNVSELFGKAWTAHSTHFKTMILDSWDDAIVRHRLVWQSSLDVLNVTTHHVWKDHSSYGYWRSVINDFQTDDHFWNAGGKKKLRELYERYYEYLAVYRGAAWNETLFKTWMKVVSYQLPQAAVQSHSTEHPSQKAREISRKRLLHRAEREHSDLAFEIVRLYLHTGNFPGDAEYLRLSDLEVLIDKLLTENQPSFIQYLGSALRGESFMVRLAEALSLTTLKRIVINLAVFNDSLREWTVLEKWLAETFTTPPVVLMETKLLFLRYIQQPALNARVEIMREYMHIILAAQGSAVAWEKKLAQLKKPPSQMADLHPAIVALIRKVIEEETAANQWSENEAPQPDELVKTLSAWLLDDTLQYAPSNLSEELQTLLTDASEELLLFLKTHWQEITMRVRLVAHTTASFLESITRLLWQEHSSYNAWRTFKETVDSLHLKRGEVTQEIVTRELYRLYFEFLGLHEHDQWGKRRFDEWMLMNLQETMPRVFVWLEQEFAKRDQHTEEDLLPGEVSPAEAFTVLKDYYRQGHFPDASVWKEFHLDWLMSRSMEQFESDVVEYVTEHLTDKQFVANVSDTLSWTVLEKIVKGSPSLRQSFETWKVVKEVFEEEGLLRTLPSKQHKTFILTFVSAPSTEAKARVLVDYVQKEIIVSRGGLLDLRRSLVNRDQRDALLGEAILIVDQLEALIQTRDAKQEIALSDFISFLLKGSDKILSPENSALYADRLLQTDPSTLADQLRTHWPSRPLRYRLASLDQHVLEGITKLVWGTHPSYSLWRTFIDWLPTQPGAETRKQLHFLYFDYLQQHGASWSERVFRDRMVIGLREYKHKIDNVLDFWDRRIPAEGTSPLIATLASKGLSLFVSQRYGRSASKEEIQHFWDNILEGETALFKVLEEVPVAEYFWTDLTETLTVSQLRHILYNLSTFQFSYLESQFQQLQHFAFSNLTVQEQDALIRTWYLALFKTFHQKGRDVEKEEAAQRSIQQVFQISTRTTLADHLRYYQSKGTDIQQLFPWLWTVFSNLWPDLVGDRAEKAKMQAMALRSEVTDLSSATGGVAGIREEYILKYTVADLIHVYLQSGEIPSWSSVKDISELQKLTEYYIQDASIEKLRELLSYQHDAATASFIKQLISPDNLQRIQRTVAGEVGDRTISTSDTAVVPPATEGVAGIREENISTYSVADLIHFYLRSGEIPSWSSVKDLSELQKIAEYYIQNASIEKLRELLGYLHDAATASYIKQLISPDRLQKIQRNVAGEVGDRTTPTSDTTNLPSAIEGAGHKEHPSGLTQAAGIRKEIISKYSVEDLIHFYLRSGEIPSWSDIKHLSELQKIAGDYIQHASVEKMKELLSYQHNRETEANLRKLFLHAEVTKMRRAVMGPAGESHVSAVYSTNVVIERQRIELLLYLWHFHELPWWYTSCDFVFKDDEASPDERELKEMVLQHHLEAFIQILRQQPEEEEMVEKLMTDVSLSFFYKIITARFPAVSGFVVTAFTLLNGSLARKEVVLSVEAGDLYAFVYRFILASEHDFSSRLFIRRLLNYIWRDEQERKQVSDILFKRAEILRQTKDNRFWIVSELLNDPETTGPMHDDSSLEDALMVRSRTVHIEKSDEGWLRDALVSYIRFGTLPLHSGEKSAFTKEVFLQILKQQTLQESASFQLIVKSLLLNLSLLNAFIQRSDQDIVDGVLELLSTSRHEEFISWKDEWVNFVAWALPEEATTLNKIAKRTLFTLLQQRADFAITHISYIVLSFETLFRETKTLSLEELTEKVRAYKEVENISTAFIEILQDALSYLQENERFKLMKSLLAPRPELSFADITDQLTGRLLVQNAGLVIIGPFLYRYFSRLQMLEENKFKSEELALRAVHLLQFMATGKTETPEHAMILNKILCGVKITTPIDRNIELTQEEIEVSESLLQGVLQNWDKLKTKSIDALREGFLMRDGYLEETEVGWMLEVDRKAMDILVDLIPWSFSMIKLGWMEKSLATTWQSSEYRDLMR